MIWNLRAAGVSGSILVSLAGAYAADERPGDALASKWFKVTAGGLIGSANGPALSLMLQNTARQPIWAKVRFETPRKSQACERTIKLAPRQEELLQCPHRSPVAEEDYPVKVWIFTEPGWRRSVEATETRFRFSRASIKGLEEALKELQEAKP